MEELRDKIAEVVSDGISDDTSSHGIADNILAIPEIAGQTQTTEQIISAWAFAHNIDGAARNDLFARLRAAIKVR